MGVLCNHDPYHNSYTSRCGGLLAPVDADSKRVSHSTGRRWDRLKRRGGITALGGSFGDMPLIPGVQHRMSR
jgi:hypothetical protein